MTSIVAVLCAALFVQDPAPTPVTLPLKGLTAG